MLTLIVEVAKDTGLPANEIPVWLKGVTKIPHILFCSAFHVQHAPDYRG